MIDSMRTILFYSYKGGSGRTVAAANVASALAKLGKRVAIVDLDFEAPGLHHLFGVEAPAHGPGPGIQKYLKGDVELDELLSDATVDILGRMREFERSLLPKTARLLYVRASAEVSLLDASDPDVGSRMQDLKDRLAADGTEILIIDGASGVRDAYAIAYDVCDEMAIFFRWSKQHVAGTLRTAEYLKRLERMNRSRPFVLIASACPSQEEIDTLADEQLRADLSRIKESARDTIRAKLAECNVVPDDVFFEIPELLEMKWRDSVIVFRSDDTPYEQLAVKLNALAPSGR
jgi:MinD-like ATPase involved in chromosome partitioning or flagellar assembly